MKGAEGGINNAAVSCDTLLKNGHLSSSSFQLFQIGLIVDEILNGQPRLLMLTFMDWMLLYLIYRFSCPFYSSAVSCPPVMYCTRSEPTGTQWGFNPCEALLALVQTGSESGPSCVV